MAICPTTEAQDTHLLVGGGCEGCELMYIGMPPNIRPDDTSPGWQEQGQKLILTGTVFQLDGKTPASDVIIYYWHTNNNGFYSPKNSTPLQAKAHGYLRGWIKTNKYGQYTIRTLRPAPYPQANIPAHIHLSIKEPDVNEYYADLYFDDDPLYLPYVKKHGKQNRAGTEVLRVLVDNNGVQIAEHDIILGLNIPNYPIHKNTSPKTVVPQYTQARLGDMSLLPSGLAIGEDSPSFAPFHAWGPDKGTRACPVCKYGRFHGILYFVGNHPNWDEIRQWLLFLEMESKQRGNELKVYFVYGNEIQYRSEQRRKQLEAIGKELNITKVALTFLPSLRDTESDVHLYKINPEMENIFVIYKHRTVVDKFRNLKPTSVNFSRIKQVLTRTKGQYFDIPALPHQ